MTTAQAHTAEADYERDPVWGPMSHPARDTIADGVPPWKDHIYLGFWDAPGGVYGFFHFNGSPNHDTTKAQLSVWMDGQMVDIRETLPPQVERMDSESFRFDMGSNLEVSSPRVTGRLTVSPRLRPVDYTVGGLVPPLVEDEPLCHWQQGFTMRGELVLDGKPVPVNALGYRTRTWGYRDDSNQFHEYVSLQACLPTRDVTVMKFLWPDGSQRTDGFVASQDGVVSIDDMRVTRGAAGETVRLRLTLGDGEQMTFERQGLAAGMWCPIGLPERDGPTFCAYDEVIDWEVNGAERGLGLVEQAIIRRVV